MIWKNSYGAVVLTALLLGYSFIFISVDKDSNKKKLEPPSVEGSHCRQNRESRPYFAKLPVLLPPSVLTNKTERVASLPGVIILGMHRSGTSVISGLMTKMGLRVGQEYELIGVTPENPKGYFERKQDISFLSETYKYSPMIGLRDMLNETNELYGGYCRADETEKALTFLNANYSEPWALKDPRLCITFRTWLPLLTGIPAILFTYRSPIDVALSLKKRYYGMERALLMWYMYNKLALQQSIDLCRSVSSYRKILLHTQEEADRIFVELTNCGVNIPQRVEAVNATEFVDISLQHANATLDYDAICKSGTDEEALSTALPSETFWNTTKDTHLNLYRACLRVYCDMETGAAFRPDYKWDENIIDDH